MADNEIDETADVAGTACSGRGVRIGAMSRIGPWTTVSDGALADTLVGRWVKLDNQVQVGHDVRIGDDTVVVVVAALRGKSPG